VLLRFDCTGAPPDEPEKPAREYSQKDERTETCDQVDPDDSIENRAQQKNVVALKIEPLKPTAVGEAALVHFRSLGGGVGRQPFLRARS
jgi:hypothetical protein